MKLSRFAVYAWSVLVYNIAVIIWGAFVRATGSGAGCGAHWPLCNGEVVPRAPRIETIIEFTHRTTSALAGLLVVVLVVWAFRKFEKGRLVRWGAALSLFFVITEGLVGAGLVLLRLVAGNQSVARAVWASAHLSNTLILLAALTLTAWWASPARADGVSFRLRNQRALAWALGAGLCGVLFLGASGAVIALGATLFPVPSAAQGLAADVSPAAHFLVRLRLIHPLFAVTFGLFVVFLAVTLSLSRKGHEVVLFARTLVGLFLAQLVIGAVNLALHAPVWLQLVHLLVADLAWVALVLMSESALAAGGKVGVKARASLREVSRPAGAV